MIRKPEKVATREHHPARFQGSPSSRQKQAPPPIVIPSDAADMTLKIRERSVRLTNLNKLFWPELEITKRDLIQYYADIAPALLPHVLDRAMVMKRYPNGAGGEFFFMKRAPSPRPDWIALCSIEHASGNVIDFPVVQDLASLLWVINLGCIDLNPWYARCDDVDLPDYLHFDLDPVGEVPFEKVLEAALLVREGLNVFKMPSYVKTTGSKGVHVYTPIERGPSQKQVWTFSKKFAQALAAQYSSILTSEYRIERRPKGRILVDYNQNAWGRTLASIYSVRPRPKATVSTPVTWHEVERGVRIEDFTIRNIPARVAKLGDLWAPLLEKRGRFSLEKFV